MLCILSMFDILISESNNSNLKPNPTTLTLPKPTTCYQRYTMSSIFFWYNSQSLDFSLLEEGGKGVLLFSTFPKIPWTYYNFLVIHLRINVTNISFNVQNLWSAPLIYSIYIFVSFPLSFSYFSPRCDHMNTTCVTENLTLETTKCFSVISTSKRMPFVFYYPALIIAAIPANVFSLYVSWQHIRQKNELGVYLFNLALSDLAFSIVLCLWVDYQWRGVWAYGSSLCVLVMTLLPTNFYTSDAFLCCVAINRYLAVVHPLKFPFIRKVGAAAAVSVFMWVLVVCSNANTISSENIYQDNDTFSMCFIFYYPLSKNSVRVVVTRFILGFIFPVLLLTFCTWRICKAVKSNRATEDQERKRVSKLLMVLLLSLLICLGPVHVMMLLQTIVEDCRDGAWLLYPFKICTAISSLNCLADPLLYCFITRTGKANVNQVILLFRGKTRSKNEGVV